MSDKNSVLKSDIGNRIDTLRQVNTGLGVSGVDPSSDIQIRHKRLSDGKLEDIYLDYDLAKVVATEPALEATRKGWVVTDDKNEKHDLDIDTSNVIKKAIIEANIYGGAAVVAIDGKPLNAELSEGNGLKNAHAISSRRISVVEWEEDALSQRFDEPLYYSLSTGNGSKVHASRVSRFFGHRLPKDLERKYSGFGQSKLQNTWDAIRRMETVEASMETAVHRAASLVVKVAGLHQMDDLEEGREAVAGRLRNLIKQIGINNAAAVSDQEDMEWISPDLKALIEIWQTLASAASRASRQPKTRLFGDSPAGLQGSDENAIQNWHTHIAELQESEVLPALRMLYRAEHGDLDGWTFEFAALDEESEREKAEKRKMTAQTDAIYLDRGVRTPDQVAKSRDGADGWSMDTRVRDDIRQQNEGQKRESLFDRLAKIEMSGARVDTDIPMGPFGSPPEELTQFLSDAGIQPVTEKAREWIDIYNSVYEETGTHSAAREKAMAEVALSGRNDKSISDIDTTPPESASNNAKKALRWREEHPDEIEGGTRVGWTRANQLADRESLSEDVISRMAAFERHRENAEIDSDKEGKPWTDAGHVAWLLWGGDTGVDWAQRKAEEFDEARESE